MTKNYKLTDICPGCASTLENALKGIKGVTDARISIMSEKLTITYEGDKIEDIFKEIKSVCKRIEPDCELYI